MVSFWTTFARIVSLTQKEVAISANDIKPQARKTYRLSIRLATPNSGSILLTPVSNHAAILRYGDSDLRWYEQTLLAINFAQFGRSALIRRS